MQGRSFMQERVLVDVSYKQGDELSSNNLLNLATSRITDYGL